MIRARDRLFVKLLVRLKVWGLFYYMRLVEVKTRRGTHWIKERMMKKQARDDAHHAPCCPANHYHYRRLVFQRCTCGAHPRMVRGAAGAWETR